MTDHLPRPAFGSLVEYGESLDDADRWQPHVLEVLTRHGFAELEVEAGFAGTYPTFLVGNAVVKLFGYFDTWRDDHATELSVHLLLRGAAGIPAPSLRAHGSLYDRSDPWAYLVTSRAPGVALREASLTAGQRRTLARQLGRAIRRVHDISVDGSSVFERDWLRDHSAGCADRHQAWESLPTRLVSQIDDYVVDPRPMRTLVHADLTADHIFVLGDRLTGVIDWGDAMATDAYYELGALHLGAFECDGEMLRSFLDGYGWDVDGDFVRRAMSAALMQQFDLFADLPSRLSLDRFDTLDELAAAIWTL